MTTLLAEAGLSECAGIAADTTACRDFDHVLNMTLLAGAGILLLLMVHLFLAISAGGAVRRAGMSDRRTQLWGAVCWLLPLLGPVLWWTVGHRRAGARRPRTE